MMRAFHCKKTLGRTLGGAPSSEGFTLIEVLISMMITLIVMSAVFGLLSRGQRTFQREPEIADMQQTARSALDMVSRDALQAGAGLPPEFPSFTTPDIDSEVGDGAGGPDTIEIVGGLGGTVEQNVGPEEWAPGSLSGTQDAATFRTLTERTGLAIGDLVVVYVDNEEGKDNDWMMSYVQDVQPTVGPLGEDQLEITLSATPPDPTDGGAVPEPYQSRNGALPSCPGNADQRCLVTPVTVVRYRPEADTTGMSLSGPPVTILYRRVNFIRKSFSSNVNPRNIIAGLAARCFEATGTQCWQ